MTVQNKIEEKPDCISVEVRSAEKARRILYTLGLLARGYRIMHNNDKVFIPVIDSEEAKRILEEQGIAASICSVVFSRKPKPKRLEGPIKSYSIIGDIAVFSKTGSVSLEEYRRAAEELLSQISRIKAVYLKTGTSGSLRVAELVHLAGEERTYTISREYGLEIEVDLAKVYYNPRLQEERRRVAVQVGDGEYILDMFAGVGVFPLHIASRSDVVVYSNDINPYAVYLAWRNALRNRRKLRGCIVVLNGDAIMLDEIFNLDMFNRIIMNNPTMTPRFLKTACRLAKHNATIHYYRLASSCKEVIEEASKQEKDYTLKPLLCRRTLEYSPKLSVYVVDFKCQKQ